MLMEPALPFSALTYSTLTCPTPSYPALHERDLTYPKHTYSNLLSFQ